MSKRKTGVRELLLTYDNADYPNPKETVLPHIRAYLKWLKSEADKNGWLYHIDLYPSVLEYDKLRPWEQPVTVRLHIHVILTAYPCMTVVKESRTYWRRRYGKANDFSVEPYQRIATVAYCEQQAMFTRSDGNACM